METAEKKITLSGSESLIPHNPKNAYLVLSGTVLVYIIPWKNNASGRRLLLCEVPQGRMIPSFVYRDQNYNQWRFLLIAQDTAQLQCLENAVTSILLRKFAHFAQLDSFDQEGFSQSVVDFYQHDELKAGVYIDRGKKREPDINIASYGVIKKAFNTGAEYSSSDDPVYKAVTFACSKIDVPVVPVEKILVGNTKETTVPAIANASRFACRNIVLEPGWYNQDCGVIIGTIDGQYVSCVPRNRSSYNIYYSETDTVAKLTPEIANTVHPQAYTISRTLPGRKLNTKDLISFCWKSVNQKDLLAILVLALISALIGVLLPTLNQIIYDEYIPLGNASQLIQLCMVICTFMIGNLLFEMVKNLSENRLTSRVGYDLQNAVYYRVFHLPESFFRNFDSADLAQRISGITTIGCAMVNTVIISGISMLFSLVYLFRMVKYSKKLAWIALVMIFAYAMLQYFLCKRTMRYSAQIAESSGKANAQLYQYLNGIDKIRMAGVEDQAAYEYLVPFTKVQTEMIKKNRLDGIIQSLGGCISAVFSMVLYYVLVKSGSSISLGSFMAFNTAFGTFSGSVLELMGNVLQTYQLRPEYDRFKPIIETAQEDEENCEIINELTGEVRMDHVSFSYTDNGPNVLNDLSLHIKPGEYIGIVGPSGCGKSTLLKLLLGFEKPKTGQICYDGHDVNTLDKRQLRKQLGVVLQNGKLIAGSIYENITITAPQATMQDVQRVVEAVGLKDDIAQMPMGLHTVLSENSGTISGGQQQRILIARAIISHPSLLIFDEATSALDNLTQAAVCESLDKMDVTRIVVAHRLSTINNCDRILVLQNGTIAEEGNYTELMARKGLFYKLATRQIVD